MLYSLVTVAKLNDVDPREWLVDMLAPTDWILGILEIASEVSPVHCKTASDEELSVSAGL